jgi:TM2 domain-containing membrane protein YozV
MDQQKVDLFIATNGKNYPEEKLSFLREQLLSLDESKWSMIQALAPQDLTVMYIVSVFAGEFGVDRFMLDDVKNGVFKLILTLCCGVGLVWWIIDLINLPQMVKEYNFKKLQMYIG